MPSERTRKNFLPETRPQGPSDKLKVAHNALLEARLKLLEELKKGDANYELKVPIEFYGMVLDQHDSGVIGAKVKIGLSPPDDTGENGHIISTDADGRLSLTGTRGKFAFVNVYSPEGYMFTAPATGFQQEIVHEIHWKAGDASQDEPGKFRFYFQEPRVTVAGHRCVPAPCSQFLFLDECFKKDIVREQRRTSAEDRNLPESTESTENIDKISVLSGLQ